MKVFENIETVVIVQEEKGIICNRCGKVTLPYDEMMQSINLPFGQYGNWKFDLCSECLFNFIKEFQIVPENFTPIPANVASLDHDLHQELFNEWKNTNEWKWEEEDPYKDYYSNELMPNELKSELDEEIEAFYREQPQTNLTLVK